MKPLAKAPHVNRLRRAASAGALVLLAFLHAEAQDPPSAANAAVEPATPEAIQAKISALENATAADDDTKARLLDLYSRTRVFQEAVSNHSAAADQYTRTRETAAEEARAIRREVEQGGAEDAGSFAAVLVDAPLDDLKAMLTQAKADQAAADVQLAEIRQALATESDRPSQVRQRLTQARQRLETVAAELGNAPPDELPAVRQARADQLRTERLALGAEIRMLDQELLSQPMRVQLLEAQRDRNEQRLATLREQIAQLEQRIGEERVTQAEETRRETADAQRQAQGGHPAVQALATANAALAEEIAEVAVRLDQTVADADAAKKRSERVQELFRSTRQKLAIAGLSEALGRVMLEQRRRLADTRELGHSIRESTHALAQAGLHQIQHEEERQRLRDPAAYLRESIEYPEDPEQPFPEDELRELVERRQSLIARALDLDQAYVLALGDLDHEQRAFLEAVTSYGAFLDERLLWVRSTAGPDLDLLTQIPSQLAELLAPANWSDVLRTLWRRATVPGLLLALLVLATGTLTRRAMYRRLVATGRYRRKPSRDRLVFTFQALGWTMLLAAPWPLFVYMAGRALATAPATTEFVDAVASVLCFIAGQFYILAAFRTACIPGGLADSHFAWPEESLVRLRRRLNRFMWVFLPANFATNLTVVLYVSMTGGGLSWLGFIVVAAALAAFGYSLFQQHTGVLVPYIQAAPGGLIARSRRVWATLAVGLPASLALLATLGYRYTAIVLLERVIVTGYFVAGIVLLHELVTRWLVLSRRRLAVRAALARRQAASAEELNRAEAGSTAPPESGAPDALEEPELDLVALGKETRQLLFYFIFTVTVVGLWMIWTEVLPALGYLNEVTLWHRTGTVEGEKAQIPVTLADSLLAVLLGVATFVVAKRLPSLLEMVLLQRLRMTPGARYAVTTLSSYAIVLLGLVVALSMVGVTWSQLQWLVAALSVGIGFGLQEIVANFISGLIILFERPIRVGDVVTVGDTDGVVTRIQIRATTIRNWERKELLVPNKEFITSRLLNWSLSDQTTRVFITVGLAYGGDVQRAMAVMAAAAEEHALVLDDPPPFVCFEGFGDNALVLNLRCYTDSLANRLQTTSELHQKIDAAFREAGLVIAFPQRDVHLDTSSPLRVSIQE